jgi:hypothetical protein
MMTKSEEKRLLRRFRRIIIESHRLTKEARAMRREIKTLTKKKLKKVM